MPSIDTKFALGPTWPYSLLAMTLKAFIHENESGGFWAEVHSLPGCVTQGDSIPELQENIREAIAAWLEAAEPDAALAAKSRILEVAV